jgi:hypothetical protein
MVALSMPRCGEASKSSMHASAYAKLGIFEQGFDPAIISGCVLGFNQQGKALLEAERAYLSVCLLFLVCQGHRA